MRDGTHCIDLGHHSDPYPGYSASVLGMYGRYLGYTTACCSGSAAVLPGQAGGAVPNSNRCLFAERDLMVKGFYTNMHP